MLYVILKLPFKITLPTSANYQCLGRQQRPVAELTVCRQVEQPISILKFMYSRFCRQQQQLPLSLSQGRISIARSHISCASGIFNQPVAILPVFGPGSTNQQRGTVAALAGHTQPVTSPVFLNKIYLYIYLNTVDAYL